MATAAQPARTAQSTGLRQTSAQSQALGLLASVLEYASSAFAHKLFSVIPVRCCDETPASAPPAASYNSTRGSLWTFAIAPQLSERQNSSRGDLNSTHVTQTHMSGRHAMIASADPESQQPDVLNATVPPGAIAWTPIQPITCCIPAIGHMGITDSQGLFARLARLPHLGANHPKQMLFGEPSRYVRLVSFEDDASRRRWDDAIEQADNEYASYPYDGLRPRLPFSCRARAQFAEIRGVRGAQQGRAGRRRLLLRAAYVPGGRAESVGAVFDLPGIGARLEDAARDVFIPCGVQYAIDAIRDHSG